jgi:transposase
VQTPPFAFHDCFLPGIFSQSHFGLSNSPSDPFLIQSQAEMIEKQRKIIKELNQTIDGLRKENEELNDTINKLKDKVGNNPRNTSMPPSSEGYEKSTLKSTRDKSDNKPGGQPGHKGRNLQKRANPTEIKDHPPAACRGCLMYDKCKGTACIGETRQEIDIIVTLKVTDHRSLLIDCPLHGKQLKGQFPDDIKATVQYGKNLQAFVISFNTIGAVSAERIHQILGSAFNIPLSPGTIMNMVKRCADKLTGVIKTIRQQIVASELIHCDETGTRVNGKLMWVHTASNSRYTHLTIHKKRGKIGIDAGEVLPKYKGIIIHDRWASYWQYKDVLHGVCGAHLLRDLTWVEDHRPKQMWAPAFKKLLLEMKATKEEAIAKGQNKLRKSVLNELYRQYDEIITLGYEENPPPPIPEDKTVGRPLKGRVLSLVEALDVLKPSVCLFIENFAVSFDNNLAERDIRPIKTKTKVSGCFRSEEGAEYYMKIMSYVGTAKKLKINPHEAILQAVCGTPEFIFSKISKTL